MGWSWRIARLFGIDVKVHWTFFLLFFYIGFVVLHNGGDLWRVAVGCGLVTAVFACIVLHELGHALTARRYGIATRDITLLPIGGVARLARIPREPWHEFWIAVAGPAVNVVIAVVLSAVLLATGHSPLNLLGNNSLLFAADPVSFARYLILVNLFLVAFNAIPAFPMDGGRVLRSLLAMRLDYLQATQVAASFGQSIAIAFGIVGLLWYPMLILIAIFVYLGASAEARMAQVKALTSGVPVSSAMITRFRTLRPSDSLQVALDELLAGSQQDFPVVEGEQLCGLLSRQQLMEGLKPESGARAVSEVMTSATAVADQYEMLEDVLMRMNEDGISTLPVVGHEADGRQRLVGMLTVENIGEFLMSRTARHQTVPLQRMSQTGE